jgi:hypothetical protein
MGIMKKISIFLVFFSILLLFGCTQNSSEFNVSYLSEDSLVKTSVLLDFDSNGTVSLDFSLPDGNKFHLVRDLNPQEVSDLAAVINSANVSGLNDVYGCKTTCDNNITTTITFSIEGKEKKVLIKDLGNLPSGLAEVVNKIQFFWGEKFSN